MPAFEELLSKLKQAGLRITPQRAAICKQLCESRGHFSASMLHDLLRSEHPSLSLMTVYNTLNVLAELGAINVLGQIGGDPIYYEAHTEPHVNLACLSCHTIADLDSALVEQLNTEISVTSGYKLLGARVLYYGYCPECQKLSKTL